MTCGKEKGGGGRWRRREADIRVGDNILLYTHTLPTTLLLELVTRTLQLHSKERLSASPLNQPPHTRNTLPGERPRSRSPLSPPYLPQPREGLADQWVKLETLAREQRLVGIEPIRVAVPCPVRGRVELLS